MISGGLGAATHPRTLTHTHAHTNIHTHRAGDLEAADVDEDFIMAIEYGMPPTAGVRMHAERGARGWGGVRGGEREDVAARPGWQSVLLVFVFHQQCRNVKYICMIYEASIPGC